jgi:hypothetical protein
MQEKNKISPFRLLNQSQNSGKIKAHQREYYRKHLEQKQVYYRRNSERIRGYEREYYQKHLEEQRKQKLEYYRKNSEKVKAYYRLNSEKIKAYRREYYQKSKLSKVQIIKSPKNN